MSVEKQLEAALAKLAEYEFLKNLPETEAPAANPAFRRKSGIAVIAAGSTYKIPVAKSLQGSKLSFTFWTEEASKGHDLGFSLERAGLSPLVMYHRITATQESPCSTIFTLDCDCELEFTFDNAYSWINDKNLHFSLTIEPPMTPNERSAFLNDELKKQHTTVANAKACVASIEKGIKKLENVLYSANRELKAHQGEIANCQANVKSTQTEIAQHAADMRNPPANPGKGKAHPLRAGLAKFLSAVDPTHASTVDALLEYDEARIKQVLMKKYGKLPAGWTSGAAPAPAPAPPAAKPAAPPAAPQNSATKQQLVRFLQQNNAGSDMIGAVDTMLGSYSTAQITTMLQKRFGKVPAEWQTAAPAAGARKSAKEELVEFYNSIGQAAMVDTADTILAAYPFDRVRTMLKSKYGKVPAGWETRTAY